MKLPAKIEYGCLAILHLAEQYPLGEPVQIRRVAAEHGIPSRFLVQILLELKRAGLVSSTRGAAGGYQLARAPDEISLGEVIAVLEGNDATEEIESGGLRGALYSACREAEAVQQERLDGISLANLLEYASGGCEPMWYI
ncbi:RrF2 family transcriptional regulator [Aeoliella sp.]|uniref:RrF2 family transcriptional regulator n=1 Tax=Aeoliella sp. TaxID=2795800 RepID=UPI003CCC1E72